MFRWPQMAGTGIAALEEVVLDGSVWRQTRLEGASWGGFSLGYRELILRHL